MSVGTIPIMPDVKYIPKFTMVHYPKKFFKFSLDQLELDAIPDPKLHSQVALWTSTFLSSEAIARYILRIARISPKNVLFLDESLQQVPDNLSCMTLIGLKHLFGSALTIAYPPGYIYSDFKEDVSLLYGKGFGYTKILERDSSNLSAEQVLKLHNFKDVSILLNYDLIIIGNISRDLSAAKFLNQARIPGNKVFIWGDDRPRSRNELEQIRNMDGFKFIREIY